jgi:hypothetical protein
MATKFRIVFTDTDDEVKSLAAEINLGAGETKEQWVADVLSNGFRMEVRESGDKEFPKKGFARRISPFLVRAVDYELA